MWVMNTQRLSVLFLHLSWESKILKKELRKKELPVNRKSPRRKHTHM